MKKHNLKTARAGARRSRRGLQRRRCLAARSVNYWQPHGRPVELQPRWHRQQYPSNPVLVLEAPEAPASLVDLAGLADLAHSRVGKRASHTDRTIFNAGTRAPSPKQ